MYLWHDECCVDSLRSIFEPKVDLSSGGRWFLLFQLRAFFFAQADFNRYMKICFLPRWLLGRWRISRCRGVFYGSLRWSYPITGTSMLPWSCWANVFFVFLTLANSNVYEFCSSVIFHTMSLCVCVREWKIINVFSCLWWKGKGKPHKQADRHTDAETDRQTRK